MSEVKNNIRYLARWIVPSADGDIRPTSETVIPNADAIPPMPFPKAAVGYEIVRQTNFKERESYNIMSTLSTAEKEEKVGRVFIAPLMLTDAEKKARGEDENAMMMRLPTIQSPSARDLASQRARIGKEAEALSDEELQRRLGKKPAAELDDRVGKFVEIAVPLLPEDKIFMRHPDKNTGALIEASFYAKSNDWVMAKEVSIQERCP